MFNRKYSLFFILFISLLMTCTSIEKVFEKGDYNGVINRLDYKATKGILMDEDVTFLLQAINKKLDKERVWLGQKLDSDEGEEWIQGYQRLDEVAELQVEFSSFKQIDKNNVNWIDIERWDIAYGDVLGNYHTETYEELYERNIETNNKNFLIEAYYELNKVAHFDQEVLHIDSLRSAIEIEGVRKLNLDFKDESFNLYELHHLQYYVNPSNSQWSNYGDFSSPDFSVFVILDEIDKDEQRIENQVEYTNDIIVDYDVQTDNDGNEVQLPITEVIAALVNEVQFQYTVEVKVRIDIYLNDGAELVSSDTFTGESIGQEIEYYIIDGNIQAIPPNISLNSGTPNSTTFNYDYDELIEDALEQASDDVESFLENW